MEAKCLITPASGARCEEFDWGRLHWYASDADGNASEQTVGKCVIRPGCGNPKHHHPNCEEVLHVLTGRIEHLVEDGSWRPMAPGDTIRIPPLVPHAARNVGDVDAELLICFSSAQRKTVGES